MVLFLGERIRESAFNPQLIVGVARGGLYMTEVLADQLNVPAVSVAIQRPVSMLPLCARKDIKAYEEVFYNQKPVLVYPLASMIRKGIRILVVDNNVTTGLTIQVLKQAFEERGLELSDVKVAAFADNEHPQKVEHADYYMETANYASFWSDRAPSYPGFQWHSWLQRRNLGEAMSYQYATFQPGIGPGYERWSLVH